MAEYFHEVFTGNNFALADRLIELMDDKLLDNGWTRFDPRNTSSFANWDVIYRSTGAANDARIYIRINRSDGADPKIVFRAYSLWYVTGSLGYNETGSDSVTIWTCSSASSTPLFGMVDQYEFTIFVDSPTYSYWSFGQPNRTDVLGEHGDFFAVGTQERAAGSSVNILIDRSILNHYRFNEYGGAYDMRVHIISQTATLGSSHAADLMTAYTEIPASSIYQITFQPLSIDVKVGYLYGLNAMPVYVSAATGASPLTGYFIFDATHSRTGPTAQPALLKPFVRDDVSAFDAPAFNQLIHGSRLAFYSSSGESFLGVLRYLSVITARGAIGKGNRFLTGASDPGNAYIAPFGNVAKWTSGEQDWTPILGPGATRD